MLKQFVNNALKFALVLTMASCKNTNKQETKAVIDSVATPVKQGATTPTETPPSKKLPLPLPEFPTMAYKIADLIPQHYEIDLEADGDLNGDGVADKIMVLINERDTTAIRPTLVLLKQGDAYSVDAVSYDVFEPKFREDGYKIYDYEEVSIDSGKLVLTKQATGPAGSIESTFKYFKNDLVLMHITTFNMGAGGQTEQKLDLLKGIYEQTDINTMKEDMPSETTTKKYKLPEVLFKNADPSAIMIEAFRKVGH